MVSELKQLIDEAEERGWCVEKTRNNHFRFQLGRQIVFTSSTPSDNRAISNIKADLRRRERIAHE